MNYFVTIEEIDEFEEVRFYSVKLNSLNEEDAEFNEFEKFLNKFKKEINPTIKQEFEDIIAIIEHIGNNSARLKFFRTENAAFALPPKNRQKIENLVIKAHSNLRLYCIVIDENNVILCNGGLKTANKAQDCPNVSKHFWFAEQLANYMMKNRNLFNIGYKTMDIGLKNGFYL